MLACRKGTRLTQPCSYEGIVADCIGLEVLASALCITPPSITIILPQYIESHDLQLPKATQLHLMVFPPWACHLTPVALYSAVTSHNIWCSTMRRRAPKRPLFLECFPAVSCDQTESSSECAFCDPAETSFHGMQECNCNKSFCI